MKKLITIILILATFTGFTQKSSDYQLRVEITDTVEIAYRTYFDSWKQDGFNMLPVQKNDSIGIDSVIIKRLYYLKKCDFYKDIRSTSDTLLPYHYKKVYLDYEEKEYPNGSKSYYDVGYGYPELIISD